MKLDATDAVPRWGVDRMTDAATYWTVYDVVNSALKEPTHGAAHSTPNRTTREKTYWTTYSLTEGVAGDTTVEFMEN